MGAERLDESVVNDPLALLERTFIDEFLKSHGLTVGTLHTLPEDEAIEIMKAASLYASCRLTEVESRAHYVHEIHDGRTSVGEHRRGR